MEDKDKGVRSFKPKNKAPAPIQISAEQLLREATERLDTMPKPVRQRVTDAEEAGELRQIKRRNFEDAVRRNRAAIGSWLKYAAYEESQRELARARSVYERALEVDARNVTIWLKYAEMEMKNKNVNLARNVWNRAVTILPFVEQFWYKFAYFEEILGNVDGARQIFARWMQWDPKDTAWASYIKLELRYKEHHRVRQIYENFVYYHPTSKNWIKFAEFEENIMGDIETARRVYERATENLPLELQDPKLFTSFAKFEIRNREFERARSIFRYALDHLSKEKQESIEKQYTAFERQHGKHDDMELLLLRKRRTQYEEATRLSPHNYDNWYDWINLEQDSFNNGTGSSLDSIRAVFEQAVLSKPPEAVVSEKKLWKRYIYLWIYYALFEELDSLDPSRTMQVYRRALDSIPHQHFTFGKIWILFSKFLIRQRDLAGARKLLGAALGKCPKNCIFKYYISMELSLREFSRVRKLYEKWLLWNAEQAATWIAYAELEQILGEDERVCALYELAITQPILDRPESIWKAYIAFCISPAMNRLDLAESLYERLLERTEHVKVWISYARLHVQFYQNNDRTEEAVSESNLESALLFARKIFSRGNESLFRNRASGNDDDRLSLLEAWLEVEETYGGSEKDIHAVSSLLPTRSLIFDEKSGEERLIWQFPEDKRSMPGSSGAYNLSSLLDRAKQWKTAQEKDQQIAVGNMDASTA